ncbi:(2Fe-2S)-binding protein [Sphingomonas sp. LY29]|uniref:(2Fe-2S)-binding protein n=1 Tax=Sphingomonas sp. LY29 TaxID=3095341 RepID=UPI002D7982BD|nr:(2Fe-2S)-binding protein [Sphingomonas sp. LY29]WRP26979.1 (2Fe-2S)-binding protein [Sphingomonas sp. LY29]
MTSMTVNGEAIRYRLDPETPLLFALRDASNLTGTKHGCYSGDCGTCTVIVDGRAMLSCQLSIAAAEGADVTTIEGLSADRAHPLQQAWAAEQVSQCGRCDPGFIMALAALMRATPNPSPEQLATLPNICRCGATPRIMKAIARAAAASAALAAPPRPAPNTERNASPSLSVGSSAEAQSASDGN